MTAQFTASRSAIVLLVASLGGIKVKTSAQTCGEGSESCLLINTFGYFLRLKYQICGTSVMCQPSQGFRSHQCAAQRENMSCGGQD